MRRLRAMRDARGSTARIEVDGGVTPEHARALVDAGADVLVAGSAVFSGDVDANVRAFREALLQTT